MSEERKQEYLDLGDGFEPDQLVVVPSLRALDAAAEHGEAHDVPEHRRAVRQVLHEATERARRTRRAREDAATALETVR